MELLSAQAQGAGYLVGLLFLCIIIVHCVKLALVGYRSIRKKQAPPPPKPKEEKEPVYYIVEKKKKRAKAEYSEPRRIQFK